MPPVLCNAIILPAGRGAGVSYDADAEAYVAAITAAGATVTGAQRRAIADFVTAEKEASRWTLHKRFFLPVWGVAAANAIDMVGLTSGTWVNSPTMAAGYVQGNGSTQWFDFNATVTDIGASASNHTLFSLLLTSDTRSNGHMAVATTGGFSQIGQFSASPLARIGNRPQIYYGSPSRGVVVVTSTSSDQQSVTRLLTGSPNTTISASAAGALAGTSRHGAMAMPNTPVDYSNAQQSLFGCGLGLTQAQAEGFASALKTLSERVTGLILS